MKTLITLALCCAALAGCATTEPVVRTVTVDKPIPFCPTPPNVPTVEYKVDALTMDDLKDPGKVGQAYKYDMLALRQQLRIYQQILSEYAKASQNFDAVKAEIDKAYVGIQPVVPVAAPSPKTP
jgi:hypothetical protein